MTRYETHARTLGFPLAILALLLSGGCAIRQAIPPVETGRYQFESRKAPSPSVVSIRESNGGLTFERRTTHTDRIAAAEMAGREVYEEYSIGEDLAELALGPVWLPLGVIVDVVTLPMGAFLSSRVSPEPHVFAVTTTAACGLLPGVNARLFTPYPARETGEVFWVEPRDARTITSESRYSIESTELAFRTESGERIFEVETEEAVDADLRAVLAGNEYAVEAEDEGRLVVSLPPAVESPLVLALLERPEFERRFARRCLDRLDAGEVDAVAKDSRHLRSRSSEAAEAVRTTLYSAVEARIETRLDSGEWRGAHADLALLVRENANQASASRQSVVLGSQSLAAKLAGSGQRNDAIDLLTATQGLDTEESGVSAQLAVLKIERAEQSVSSSQHEAAIADLVAAAELEPSMNPSIQPLIISTQEALESERERARLEAELARQKREQARLKKEREELLAKERQDQQNRELAGLGLGLVGAGLRSAGIDKGDAGLQVVGTLATALSEKIAGKSELVATFTRQVKIQVDEYQRIRAQQQQQQRELARRRRELQERREADWRAQKIARSEQQRRRREESRQRKQYARKLIERLSRVQEASKSPSSGDGSASSAPRFVDTAFGNTGHGGGSEEARGSSESFGSPAGSVAPSEDAGATSATTTDQGLVAGHSTGRPEGEKFAALLDASGAELVALFVDFSGAQHSRVVWTLINNTTSTFEGSLAKRVYTLENGATSNRASAKIGKLGPGTTDKLIDASIGGGKSDPREVTVVASDDSLVIIKLGNRRIPWGELGTVVTY